LGELPFINRVKTRQAIEYFTYPLEPSGTDPSGIRVFIVNGPKNSGKSFTYDYILYLSSIFAKLNFIPVWIDYKKYVTSRFGPLDLADKLLDQINPDWEAQGIELPKLDTARPERLKIQIIELIISQINSANRKKNADQLYYFVLDGFDTINVPDDTIELIQMFASVATGALITTEDCDKLRIVLLGYNVAIPNFQGRVEIEDIEPLNSEDIRLYFRRYASFNGFKAEESLIEALTNMVENITTDPDKRTEQIAKMALKVAHETFSI
jgi:hypothetical protein